jgi:peptide/nickel transport system substrate-binding protein
MRDEKGRPVEFDLTISADQTIGADIASVLADECGKVGITVRIKPTDFQKIIEQLTKTYDWHSVIIGFGPALFPSQGSNVWPSRGNLHLWYPLQETPATEWEARLDWLYNEGNHTIDAEKARVLWDEYQSIILEQCPIVYLVSSRRFTAVRNRIDMTNVFYDNVGKLLISYAWLK